MVSIGPEASLTLRRAQRRTPLLATGGPPCRPLRQRRPRPLAPYLPFAVPPASSHFTLTLLTPSARHAGDVLGEPLLDECHGHFGPTDAADPLGSVSYHYHASPEYNLQGQPHRPYYLGCLGPSKGSCNSTVDPAYDGGANWCSEGCGAQLCVQPGTDRRSLHDYVRRFDPSDTWLSNFTINDYAPPSARWPLSS